MPPYGLYSVPRQHLYGRQTTRLSFNSNDFQDGMDVPAQVEHTPAPVPDKLKDSKREYEENPKKMKKKRDSLGKEKRESVDGADMLAKEVLSTSERKVKPKKSKKESSEATQDQKVSKKKRKRESELNMETPATVHTSADNSNFVVVDDSINNVATKLHDNTPQTSEKPPKQKRSGRKSQDIQASNGLSEKPKVKKHKVKSEGSTRQEVNDVPTLTATARRTPVPLPRIPQPISISGTSHLQHSHSAKPISNKGVLVPETPPIISAVKARHPPVTPVPFPHLQSTHNATTSHKPSKKDRRAILPSTPTTSNYEQIVKKASPVTIKLEKSAPTPSIPNALTDANLNKHTQPLNDESKPRPRSKGAMSTVTSQADTTSSMSTKDAFVRVGKPYARSGAEVDPFIAPEAKPRKHREIHEEATMNIFNEKFYDVQRTVNFSEEQIYLDEYLAWSIENESHPLPCLGNVTGCTTKKEEILRLSREENLTILSHLDTNANDLEALKEAGQMAHTAEELLILAIRARIPVPIGRLDGVWTLFCPKYAQTHFDRYGYGQRTLTISSIAGFKHVNSYTARLNIPPRSMSYSLLAFSTPPHASFRTTTIKTAAEGYAMDIAFLGNGYLQLRVDLKLLLKGKATEEVEGKEMHMEFIGVHEKAVQWWDKRNDLEEEGKKLFAKYDG